jgi:hypothetical protein
VNTTETKRTEVSLELLEQAHALVTGEGADPAVVKAWFGMLIDDEAAELARMKFAAGERAKVPEPTAFTPEEVREGMSVLFGKEFVP